MLLCSFGTHYPATLQATLKAARYTLPGLYLVRCKPIKEALAAAARQLASGLLEHVRQVLRASSADACQGCTSLAAEVSCPQ